MRHKSEEFEKAVPLEEESSDKEIYIKIRDLHKRFGKTHVLRGINLNIYKGETLVILGISGSGKTTFIKHLMGTHTIDEGSIIVGEHNLANLTNTEKEEYNKKMGVVFQMAALLGSLSVYENVGLPLIEVSRLPKEEVEKRVIKALRSVFLPAKKILDLKPNELSGGMRKRVGIARAIIQEPELILYDEPTTGLDPVTVSGVNELTLKLQKSLNVTSVVITHDMEAAFTIADRIAFLYKGRIVAIGTPDEIKANKNIVLQQLLSGSTIGPLTEQYK